MPQFRRTTSQKVAAAVTVKPKEGIAIVALLVLGVGSMLLLRKKAEAVPVARRPPCGNAGDLNGDGFVTLEDLDLLVQYILVAESLSADQVSRADLNGDGSVTALDLTLMENYIAGAIDTFPVCAITPGSNLWSFSNFIAQVVPWVSPAGYTFYFVTYSVIVKNNGSQPATKTVSLYVRTYAWFLVESRQVTLAAGQTYLFSAPPPPDNALMLLAGYPNDIQFRTSDGELSNILRVSV